MGEPIWGAVGRRRQRRSWYPALVATSTPETVSVRIRGLCKSFAEVRAVQDVDLDLCAGQIHGVLGENGAGKTTLMCMLAGLYRPDGGTMEQIGRAHV